MVPDVMVAVMMPSQHESLRYSTAAAGVNPNSWHLLVLSQRAGTVRRMKDTLINLAVFVGILGGAALFTEWFTRKMYYRCRRCLTLNARRRSQCRQCGESLP
jgi:ribosomal protein L40E